MRYNDIDMHIVATYMCVLQRDIDLCNIETKIWVL